MKHQDLVKLQNKTFEHILHLDFLLFHCKMGAYYYIYFVDTSKILWFLMLY